MRQALTIAGSDSGGGAGIQADLKTFHAHGVFGASVLTAVTAQNTVTVTHAFDLPPSLINAQLDAVLADYGARSAKTGFIGRADLAIAVAQQFVGHKLSPVVVDPVLVNHRGEAMFPPAVTKAYAGHLLPVAELVTPNLREAGLLSGRPVGTVIIT